MFKKSLIITALLLLTACTTSPTTSPSTIIPAVTDQPEVETAPSSKLQLAETGSMASCTSYELLDENGTAIASFDCPLFLELSPNEESLMYISENWDLQLFESSKQESKPLMTFYDDTEGVDCAWSPGATRIACVSVNQQGYDSLTKIFILTLENGELVDKKSFSETVDFVCGAGCYPKGFWFEDENTFKYMGHSVMEDPQETHTVNLQ